jgi:superfamily II DNA or RNA helicase
MKPFDFQLELIDKIKQKFRKRHKRVIGQACTGFGKTVVMAHIAASSIEKGNVVCIICHRDEIFKQIIKALRAFGITPGIITSKATSMPGHQCYVAMVETLYKRIKKDMIQRYNINFFIGDEAHYGAYYKIIKDCNLPWLGMTATPKSTGSPELNEYFEDIACGINIRELIRMGRLVPATTFSVTHDFSKVKKKGRDYDSALLIKEFRKPKLWTGAVKSYLKHSMGKQALCFNIDVEQSLDVVRQFRDAGIRAGHVDGSTSPEDRKAIFKMYEDGQLQVLCNVGIATAGYDNPATECIIKNYSTLSLVKDVQVAGRGARCMEGKKRFDIHDMGRNWVRHGNYGDDINWEYIFSNPKEETSKEEKNKLKRRECDECSAVIKFSLKVCPFCGHETSEKEMEQKILQNASTEEVKAYRLQTLPHHLRKPIDSMNYQELTSFAQHMGYQPKWVGVQMGIRKRRF